MSLIAFASSASSSSSSHQDALLQMNMRTMEQMESGPYPVREGEQDCTYYIRTGLCRFGATCRFNHPLNRTLAITTARMKSEYPERIGQPECQYYLKTGTCKFGATCKFHHPRDELGIAGRVALNVLGYPLRPNEINCAYYMRNGLCKFGRTCKFHHPQPSNNMMVPLRDSALHPPIQSPTTGQLSFHSAPLLPSPQWQTLSSYAPLFMPQGVASAPGWNTYSGQVEPVSPSENQHQTSGNIQNDGTSYQVEGINVGSSSNSLPIGYYAFKRDNVFPERPGQPECQFYMKTGDCKFGAVCKFHHPRERLIPLPDCVLSPIGLPLRPGEPLCVFYSRYGVCKFGPSCKFDHPMRVFAHNAAASASTDGTAVRDFMASSPGTLAISFSPDGLVDAGSTNNRQLSFSESRQKSSGDNNIDTKVHLAGCWSSQTPGSFLIRTPISDDYGSTVAPCSKIGLVSTVESARDSSNIHFTDCQRAPCSDNFLPGKLGKATCHLYLATTNTLRDYGRCI